MADTTNVQVRLHCSLACCIKVLLSNLLTLSFYIAMMGEQNEIAGFGNVCTNIDLSPFGVIIDRK